MQINLILKIPVTCGAGPRLHGTVLQFSLQWSICTQRSVHHEIQCTGDVSGILVVGFDMVDMVGLDRSSFDSLAIAAGATNKSLRKFVQSVCVNVHPVVDMPF